jgi:enoyl-CoA hydratase/carnithine racemase
VRQGLLDGFKRALDDPMAKAVIVIGKGKTFIAGADIKEFGQGQQGMSILHTNFLALPSSPISLP